MVTKTNFLHSVEKNVPRICTNCTAIINKSELVYSKRHKRSYCLQCSILLGFVKIQNAKQALEQGIIVAT